MILIKYDYVAVQSLKLILKFNGGWKINKISIEYINNRPLSQPSLWVLSKHYVKFMNFASQNSSAGCHNFLLMKFSHLAFEFIHEFRCVCVFKK